MLCQAHTHFCPSPTPYSLAYTHAALPPARSFFSFIHSIRSYTYVFYLLFPMLWFDCVFHFVCCWWCFRYFFVLFLPTFLMLFLSFANLSFSHTQRDSLVDLFVSAYKMSFTVFFLPSLYIDASHTFFSYSFSCTHTHPRGSKSSSSEIILTHHHIDKCFIVSYYTRNEIIISYEI